MPRQIRIEYPGASDHIMSRGDRREDIFYDDVDRQDFPKTSTEDRQNAVFQVHAYWLMRNHFHLILETPQGNFEWVARATRPYRPATGRTERAKR